MIAYGKKTENWSYLPHSFSLVFIHIFLSINMFLSSIQALQNQLSDRKKPVESNRRKARFCGNRGREKYQRRYSRPT